MYISEEYEFFLKMIVIAHVLASIASSGLFTGICWKDWMFVCVHALRTSRGKWQGLCLDNA